MHPVPHQIAFQETTDAEGRRVLVAMGEVDLDTAPLLRRRIQELAQPGETLVIDLRDVTHMDSPGFGTILLCDQQQRDQGGELVMKDPSDDVREFFEVVEIARSIRIE